MIYCVNQNVIDRYTVEALAQLTGDPTGTVVNLVIVDASIVSFAAEMDGFVRVNHPELPFDSSHQLLNSLNIDGAYLKLRQGRDVFTDSDSDFRKTIMKTLAQISSGAIVLQTAVAAVDTESMFISKERIFGGSRNAG